MFHVMSIRVLASALALFGPVLSGYAAVPPTSPAPAVVSQPRIAATMMGMPLQFEANHGQVDAHVKFLSRGSGYTLFLTPTESVMVLQQREATSQPRGGHDPLVTTEPAPIKQSVVRMKLEGANPTPAIDGMEQLPGIVNYFIGNDPAKWRTKIPTYAKVQYKEAYPGIDLAYYGNQGKLEYDFIVAPGADPSQIKLAFEGTSDIRVAASGDLVLTTAVGDVRVQKPVVYQLEKDGHKTLVAGNYIASPKVPNAVGIQLAAYDHTKPVVIDPVLSFSTYLGGTGNDQGSSIAVDAAGQAYVTGSTSSTNFPTVTPAQATYGGGDDTFVTKLNAAGTSLLYSTYLGGSGSDNGAGIAVDVAGQAYVTGRTLSANFPMANPVQATRNGPQDAFVTKLNAAGTSLLYSTYLGGNSGDTGAGIAVDSVGQAYVTGGTQSVTFPTVSPVQATLGVDGRDAFVTKLSAAGTSLLYSTYLGGNSTDMGTSIAVDAAGQAYVTGLTDSTNFSTVTPAQATYGGGGNDAFVTKLSAAGTSLLYSTYLGGNNADVGASIAVDAAGQAYVTGQTQSTNFPTVFPVQPTLRGSVDAFVTKLSAAGSSLLYSTYLGGNSVDAGASIAVDAVGQAYVTGLTDSTNFPTATPVQATLGGGSDAFVTKLNAAGSSLLYSTYLGGNSFDASADIAVDAVGQAYVTGLTQSTNFPMANPIQATLGGVSDVFVTKLVEKPLADAGPNRNYNEGQMVVLNGLNSTGLSLTYIWTQVAGPAVALTNSTSATPYFIAPQVSLGGATLTFQLVVCEGTSSNCSDPALVNISVSNINQPPVADAGAGQTVQEGSPVILNGTASYDPDAQPLTYHWTQLSGPAVTLVGANTSIATFTAPSVGATGATITFDLTVMDEGLTGSVPVSVVVTNVNQVPVANAGPSQTVNELTPVTLNGSASVDPDLDLLTYAWNQVSGPLVPLTGGTTVSPTFTAPNVGPGGAALTFQLLVSDGRASSAPAQVTVNVQDVNDMPVCTAAKARPKLLWPPNHKMVKVKIRGISQGTSRHDDDDEEGDDRHDGHDDRDGQDVQITITSVTQDEPVNGLGDGDTSPDAAVSGNNVLLRAERAGSGNGRVYEVHFTAQKGQGPSCSGTVKVRVPRNKKDNTVDSGQLYNSFGQ
jgi:hypothetical protein